MQEVTHDDYCAIKVQSLVRVFLVRARLLKKIFNRYEKIYDPKRRRHYYYDKDLDKSSWIKPALLLKSDFPQVAPTYTKQEAVLVLQKFFRKRLALSKVRLLYQQVINVIEDYEAGQKQYINTLSGNVRSTLPLFMNGKLNYRAHGDTAGDDDQSMESEDGFSESSEVHRDRRRRKRKLPR